MHGSIVVEVRLPAILRQDTDYWVAGCRAIDVWSQGRTEAEALLNLEDAVQFFIESCIERGTFFEVLRESGFERLAHTVPAPDPSSDEAPSVSVSVPFPLIDTARATSDETHQQY